MATAAGYARFSTPPKVADTVTRVVLGTNGLLLPTRAPVGIRCREDPVDRTGIREREQFFFEKSVCHFDTHIHNRDDVVFFFLLFFSRSPNGSQLED